MLPQNLAHCEGDTTSHNEEKSSMPDLKCVAHTKPDDCNTAIDSNGSLCTWCVNPTLPFLKVCMTYEERNMLPKGTFNCGDTNNKDTIINTINENLPDTSCIQHTEKESCISSVDVSGWRCAWCKCDTLTWLSTCVSQKEAVQFPKGLYDCQHDADRQKERENFIK